MNNKKNGFLLATAATGAALVPGAGPGAMAADMPVKAAVAPVVVPASWAGFYIGAHAGVAWQRTHNSSQYFIFDGIDETKKTGFIGGGQIGVNFQSGNIVYGLEGDISGLSGKGTDTGAPFGYSASNQIRWLATIRPRLGVAAGNTLIYGTGGVAFGGVRNRAVYYPNGGSLGSTSESKTRVGWTAGGGIEHMWSRNWTIALEGLYVDLGKKVAVNPGDSDKTTRFSNKAVIGRVKVNYKW
jgi:outer membrane immunogenic protein